MSELTQREVLFILSKISHTNNSPEKAAVVRKLKAMHDTTCEKCGSNLTLNGCSNTECTPF